MLEARQFRNAILCEDIREEAGNKKSLMGVFGGDVWVNNFPAQLRVAFYAEYLPNADLHDLQFTLSLSENKIAEGAIQIPADRKQVVTLAIPQGVLLLKEPGDIVLRVGFADEMLEILRKKVQLAPNLAS